MSTDLATRLRTLAQEHHAGRLDRTEYRKLRAQMIDSLALPGMRVVDEMATTQPRIAGRAASPSSVSKQQAASAGAKRPTHLVVIGLFVVIAVAAAWWLLRGSPPEQAVPASAAPTNPVYEAVHPFLERGEWSDERVTALNIALLELGPRKIAESAGEHWFQRFVGDLRQRFKEQQALAAAPLTPQTSPLAALAVTVGLDLKSPDAAIHIANIEPPVSAPAQPEPTAHPAAPKTEKPTAPESQPTPEAKPAAKARDTTPSTTAAAQAAPAVALAAAREDPCRPELIRSRRPFCQDTLPSGAAGPQLALIPAGTFEMGGDAASEQPAHVVTIREPFAISVQEVSQAEFKQYCDSTGAACAPQPWSGDDYPVVNVSWRDARAYVEWLSRVTGHRYGLPSEAQWEYAARAGQRAPVPGGTALSPTDAHFSMLTKQSSPARRSQKFNQNAFRLLHTLGNVREWVEDSWSAHYSAAPSDGSAISTAPGDTRVVRGGSYADNAAALRFSAREGLRENTRDAWTGFRVMREVP